MAARVNPGVAWALAGNRRASRPCETCMFLKRSNRRAREWAQGAIGELVARRSRRSIEDLAATLNRMFDFPTGESGLRSHIKRQRSGGCPSARF